MYKQELKKYLTFCKLYLNFLIFYYRRLATTQGHIVSKLKRSVEKDILPPKPKKPLNTFMLYFLSVKDKFHKEYPNYTHKEILKKVAEQWSQVDSTVKQNLQKQYMEQSSVYKQKLLEYKNSITDDQQILVQKELIKKEHALQKSQIKEVFVLRFYTKISKNLLICVILMFLFLTETCRTWKTKAAINCLYLIHAR